MAYHNRATRTGRHNYIIMYDDIYVAGAIRKLCDALDSGLTQCVDSDQLSSMIDLLCTK